MQRADIRGPWKYCFSEKTLEDEDFTSDFYQSLILNQEQGKRRTKSCLIRKKIKKSINQQILEVD